MDDDLADEGGGGSTAGAIAGGTFGGARMGGYVLGLGRVRMLPSITLVPTALLAELTAPVDEDADWVGTDSALRRFLCQQ
jgi:hypothetical protein